MDKIKTVIEGLKSDELKGNMPGRVFKSHRSAIIASTPPFGLIASCAKNDGSLWVYIGGELKISFE